MWRMILWMIALSSISIVDGCGDGAAGCAILKITECGGSNRMDIGIALDKSGSMTYLVDRDSTQTECQGTDIGDNCLRQDLMRSVMRIVIKRLFILFEKPCLEYLQSSVFRGDQSKTCAERGFIRPRFNTVFWSGTIEKKDLQLGEVFDDKTMNWGTDFIGHFYKKEKQNDQWVPIEDPNKWEQGDNKDFKFKDTAIDNFFDNVFMADGYKSAYRKGTGGTYPDKGVRELKNYMNLQKAYESYTDDQKEGSIFPIFLMTDGQPSEKEAVSKLIQAVKDFKTVVEAEKYRAPDRVQLYGLGLTAASSTTLKETQKTFFEDTGFTYNLTDSNGQVVDFFFRNKNSANKVIDIIFDKITSQCQHCWIRGTEKVCDAIGSERPKFQDEEIILPAPEDPAPILEVKVVESTVDYNTYLYTMNESSGDESVYFIPADTKQCLYGYADTSYQQFLQYEGGKCECCENDEANKCICDRSLSAGIVRDGRAVTKQISINGSEPRTAIVYNDDSDFVASISAFKVDIKKLPEQDQGSNNNTVDDVDVEDNVDDENVVNEDDIDIGDIPDADTDGTDGTGGSSGNTHGPPAAGLVGLVVLALLS